MNPQIRTSDHPFALPPHEDIAVNYARLAFNAALQGMKPRDFAIPRETWETVEAAFQHWPTYDDETGEPIVVSRTFVDPHESRIHFMFKGVHCFPSNAF